MPRTLDMNHENCSATAGRGVCSPAPPFVLEATRRAAVDHIARYQEVNSHWEDRNDRQMHDTAAQEDTLILQRIVQGKLTIDLNELICSATALEELLIERRNRVWFLQGLIAAGVHFMLRNRAVDAVLQQPSFTHWICLAYYPVALYKIRKFENSISSTISAREAFKRLLESVLEGRGLQQTDIDYVTGKQWDNVPWKELPYSIYSH